MRRRRTMRSPLRRLLDSLELRQAVAVALATGLLASLGMWTSVQAMQLAQAPRETEPTAKSSPSPSGGGIKPPDVVELQTKPKETPGRPPTNVVQPNTKPSPNPTKPKETPGQPPPPMQTIDSSGLSRAPLVWSIRLENIW